MFKGYIITKNKAPIAGETFKNKSAADLRTLEEVKNLSDYAGILADGVVVVDVDDEEQSKILYSIVEELGLNTRVYRTTRGMHFYFKATDRTLTNKVNTHTAIGLRVDMKLGSRNSYVGLKHEGVPREIIYDTDGNLDNIPGWLAPISYTFPFLTMEDGDGRNQALYNYILTLQGMGYSKEEIRETLTLINNHVMDEPLSNSELETVMRDDAFSEAVFMGGSNGSTFLFDKFARYMASEHNIIKINDVLHLYKDGVYLDGDHIIEGEMIKHIPTLRHASRVEVLRYLNILIQKNTEPSPARYIAFNNGVYDITDDSFSDFNRDLVIKNKIPWDYNPAAYSEIADKTLDKMACYDEEIRNLMDEVIGYTFYRRNEMGKAFILTGNKANGKSTYLNMIKNLLGGPNYTTLDLNELGQRFKTAELFGKLANIGDDIGADFISDTSVFKKLTTGEALNVERKGADPFDLMSHAKLMFSANDVPRMRDRTGAVLRRLVIVPFNATFSPQDEDYDPYIRYKLQDAEVMEYMINIGIQGLKRVLYNNDFTESVAVSDRMDEYELENNPIKLFIMEYGDVAGRTTQEVFSDYVEFCHLNNLKPMSRLSFTRSMCYETGLESRQIRLDGTRVQRYVEEEG